MSELRKNLQAARSEYESIRYPGNLAGEVLHTLHSPRRTIFRLIASVAAVSGIAAAVAIWMSIQPIVKPPQSEVAISSPQPTELPITQETDEFSWAVPEVPSFPEGIQLMPTSESMALPSIPTFPTLEELEREASTSTTQESV